MSGSQILYGRYLAKDRQRIHGLFTVDILVSAGLSVSVSLLLILGVAVKATALLLSEAWFCAYGTTARLLSFRSHAGDGAKRRRE